MKQTLLLHPVVDQAGAVLLVLELVGAGGLESDVGRAVGVRKCPWLLLNVISARKLAITRGTAQKRLGA